MADIVIAAIGQTQDLSFINDEFQLKTNEARCGRLQHDPNQSPDVFCRWNAVTGPATAIQAIAAGAKGLERLTVSSNNQPLPKAEYDHVMGKKIQDVSPIYYEGEVKKEKQRRQNWNPASD
jgi:formate dehydrogenase major subunit